MGRERAEKRDREKEEREVGREWKKGVRGIASENLWVKEREGLKKRYNNNLKPSCEQNSPKNKIILYIVCKF